MPSQFVKYPQLVTCSHAKLGSNPYPTRLPLPSLNQSRFVNHNGAISIRARVSTIHLVSRGKLRTFGLLLYLARLVAWRALNLESISQARQGNNSLCLSQRDLEEMPAPHDY